MDRLDGCRSLSGVAGMEHGQGSLNISDVIEVIQTTDPEFGVDTMYPGGTVEDSRKKNAYVKILEQPASKALRFRYECEGRSAGSIPGVNSTPENKTFPTIQIVGYKGPAVVVVSCVTKDPPHRPHPHNLVGKEGCKKGICTMRINSDTMTVTFSNLGIQCVKKKDIEDALKVREEIRVDPFHTGFSHRSQHTSIDLNAVRLCFQVFLEDEERERFTLPLAPVVSEPIFDKKAMSDLVICKLSDCSCTVAGGKEIILLCEKVAKEDIQVYFFEEKDGNEVWHGLGDFQPTHVHKQVAISFRTPSYKTLQVESPVTVNIQLRRPSDGATSEPLPFQYLPIDSELLKRKRQKFVSETNTPHSVGPLGEGLNMPPSGPTLQMQQLPRPMAPVKIERPDMSYNTGYRFQSPYPSPQPLPTPSPHSRGTPSPNFPPAYHGGGGLPMQEGTFTYNVPGAGGTGGGQVIQRMLETTPGSWVHGAGVSLPEYNTIRPVASSQVFGTNVFPHQPPTTIVVNNDFLGIGSNMIGATSSANMFTNPVMAGTSGAAGGMMQGALSVAGTSQKETPTNSCIMDLDSHQPYNLDSGDLARIDMMLNQNLSENLSSNLTLNENRTQHHQQQQSSENMSDSLLSLKKEIINLNDLFKGGVGDGDRQ